MTDAALLAHIETLRRHAIGLQRELDAVRAELLAAVDLSIQPLDPSASSIATPRPARIVYGMGPSETKMIE